MRRFLLLAALALCAALPLTARSARQPPTIEIERLTWLEVRDRIAGGATTILVPTGGTEQNGPHMALGKHKGMVGEIAGPSTSSLAAKPT